MHAVRNELVSKKQRISQACDACRRRKTKCVWRPPSCTDCLRLKVPCTFASIQSQSNEDANTNPVSNYGDTVDVDGDNTLQLRSVDAIITTSPSTPVVNARPVSHGSGRLSTCLEQYLTSINHFLPIHDTKRLRVYGENESTDSDQLTSAIVACVGPRRAASTSSLDTDNAEKGLEEALAAINDIIFGQTSLSNIQLLLTIVVGLQRLRPGNEAAAKLLAIASRIATSLSLHRLNEITDIGFLARLESLQVFWCLYMLDVETSMRNHVPPSIHYDEVDALLIEPPLIPHHGYGIVQSLSGTAMLNLTSARQRLARIAALTWKELYTSRARMLSSKSREEAIIQLNDKLKQWRIQWFEYGPASELSQNWQQETHIHFTDLQFTFFHCLLKANPNVLTSAAEAVEVCSESKNQDELLRMPHHCLEAARDTLRLAMTVQSGDAGYICNAMQYTIPATVVLLASAMGPTSNETHSDDFGLARTALEFVEHLVDRGGVSELQSTFEACQTLWGLASSRSGLYRSNTSSGAEQG